MSFLDGWETCLLSKKITVSVVVPLFNEAPNVAPLVDAVRAALPGGDWELLLVDDGSQDGTGELADEYANSDERVRVVHLARNFGQTAAMKAGFDHARGDVVVSMDGDLQNDPRDIVALIAKLGEGFDLVAGYREDRKDAALTRRLPSWLANQLIRALTGVRIRDTGCSLRAYRASVTRRIQLYSDLHRFLPAVAVATCGARVTEVPVHHHSRRHGRSKYSLARVWRVLLDLLALTMILSFREQPLRMFGLLAFVCFELALVSAAISAIVMTMFMGGDHLAFVFPAITILLFGLSFYLVMLGFIGEVVVRQYWMQANPLSDL